MNTSPTLNYAYHLTPERVEEIQTRLRNVLHEKYATPHTWEIKNIDQLPAFLKTSAAELEINEDEMIGYILHIILLTILELRRHFSIRRMDRNDVVEILTRVVDAAPHATVLIFNGIFDGPGRIQLEVEVEQHAKNARLDVHDVASALAGFMCLVTELLVFVHDHG